jgi:hypothetical protein
VMRPRHAAHMEKLTHSQVRNVWSFSCGWLYLPERRKKARLCVLP